jgi:DNA-binding transcriptional LysR family regulator
MEIIQLQSLYEIATTGSFSGAAEKLCLTQSAISHQIRNLEREFKVNLFERKGKIIKLTEEGKILFDVVSDFLNDLDKLKKLFDDVGQSNVGHLAVAASSPVVYYILPDVIQEFKQQFPGIKLKLISRGFVHQLVSLVSECAVDFAIAPRINELHSKNIDFVFWKSFDTVLLMAKGHPLSTRKTIDLADIASCPLIFYGAGSVVRPVAEDIFRKNNLDYEIVMEVDELENIKKYVETGVGVSIVSTIAISNTDSERFAFFNVTNHFGRIDFGIYLRNDKHVKNAMKQFLNLFSKELSDKLSSKSFI